MTHETTPHPVLPLPGGEYILRGFAPGDADAIVRHANNRNVWINLRDVFPFPYERHHADFWIREVNKGGADSVFAIAHRGEVIGGIGLHAQTDILRRSMELGYWLGEEYWGRGIATMAVRTLTAWAFTELDIDRIFAYHFAWNPASGRVLEKAGFTLEGRLRHAVTKDGRTTDMFVYGMIRTDPR